MIKAAIITAAGSSSRMKGKGKKEFKVIKGRTVLERAVLPFVISEEFEHICVTYPKGKKEEMVSLPLASLSPSFQRKET